MIPTHRLKATEVEVFTNKERNQELPIWLSTYERYSAVVGNARIGRGPTGDLFIPDGKEYQRCTVGDHLIWNGHTIRIVTTKELLAEYEPLPEQPDTLPVFHPLPGSAADVPAPLAQTTDAT